MKTRSEATSLSTEFPHILSIIYVAAIAESVCRLFSEYQIVYSIHDNTKFLHVHMALNNIPVYGDKQASYKLKYNNLHLLALIAERICMYTYNLKKESSKSIADQALDSKRLIIPRIY